MLVLTLKLRKSMDVSGIFSSKIKSQKLALRIHLLVTGF